MLKPTEDEMHEALTEAERMRETGDDSHNIARSLEYLSHRVRNLEAVFDAANKYIHFGQEEIEHAILVKAIETARSEEIKDKDEDEETFGL